MKSRLGQTDILVSAIGLGGMPLSIQGRPSEELGIKVIHAAIENGINFIDTADVYCLDDNDIGHNERLIQKALQIGNKIKDVCIATKGGFVRPQGRWGVNADPSHLRQACEKSLKNLKSEVITLYQLHAPDPKVPFADSVGELFKLKEEGKILHIGLSNVHQEQIEEALTMTPITSVQNRCNPFYKEDLKSGLVDYCKTKKITYIPHSPVGGGRSKGLVAKHPILKELSTKYNCSPFCIALSWLLNQGEHVLPIPGASRVESAVDSSRAIEVKLDKSDENLIMNIVDA